ncbi:MAG: DUF2808 domain-containing protein [Cyanobium sp. ELA507]
MPPLRPLGALRLALAHWTRRGSSRTSSQPRPLIQRPISATALGAAAALALTATQGPALLPGLQGSAGSARAQGTPGLMEFRWDNTKDYNKLYFFVTNTIRLQRSDYYLILRPKDRNTAILKLTITVPDHFDAKLNPKLMKFCRMSQGGMTKRTRCESEIPATIEVAANGKGIEIFPNTPIPVGGTVGLFMTLFNPFNAGMFQFNALAQAPGEIPISGYLGSWLIEIDPN